MDHLGFKVENLDSFKKDLQALVKRNPALSPKPGGTEGEIRLSLLAKCQHGQFQMADPDGVPIDRCRTLAEHWYCATLPDSLLRRKTNFPAASSSARSLRAVAP